LIPWGRWLSPKGSNIERRRLKVPKGKESQKTKAVPEAKGKEVELSSLAIGQLFKYNDKTYSKRRPGSDGIRALSAKGDELTILAPKTLVTPIE
jgi:hypothetical protein